MPARVCNTTAQELRVTQIGRETLQGLLKAFPSHFQRAVVVEIWVPLEPTFLTVFQMPSVALLGH